MWGLIEGKTLADTSDVTFLVPGVLFPIRIISFAEARSYSEPLFKSLNLLNDIIKLQVLSFVYQWSPKLLPFCFNECFKFITSDHSYATRQS